MIDNFASVPESHLKNDVSTYTLSPENYFLLGIIASNVLCHSLHFVARCMCKEHIDVDQLSNIQTILHAAEYIPLIGFGLGVFYLEGWLSTITYSFGAYLSWQFLFTQIE